MLVFGAVLGAFLAAWHGNELRFEWIPPMWAARFGEETLVLRLAAALAGEISSPSAPAWPEAAPVATASAERSSSRLVPGLLSPVSSSAESQRQC